MRKLLFAFAFYIPVTLFAQDWEVGPMLGATNYNGDLSYKVYAKESHPAVGVAIRLNASKYLSFRSHLLYGTISGADSNGLSTKEGAYNRNLSFKSPIYEFALQMEFHFTRLFGSKFRRPSKTSLYAFGGIAGFHFNPKAEYNGEWIKLQPLGTEGQGTIYGLGDKYSLYEISLPMGIAFRTSLNSNWNLTYELGARMTFTEHLDDVGGYFVRYDLLAQTNGVLAANLADRTPGHVRSIIGGSKRGNPEIDDYYFFTGIILTYYLRCRDHCYRF